MSRIAMFCLLSCSMVLIGCSSESGPARKPVYKVTGKVTMSGGPVANAIVTFSPKSKQPVAMGKTDNDGKFTVTTYDPGDGAAEGDFVVLVTKQSAPQAATVPAHDPSKPYDSSAAHSQSAGAKAATEVGLPEKYSRIDQTDLKVNVKKSGNDFPLELKP